MKPATLCTIAALLVAVVTPGLAVSAIPGHISIQGRLTDNAGSPLPPGFKQFTFRIFNAATGGTELWPGGGGEVQFVSTDAEGLWNAAVGSVQPLPNALFADTMLWLQITVDDGLNPPETLSRIRLGASAYAGASIFAVDADSADFAATIADLSVTAAKISSGAVGTAHLADNAVVASKLAAGAVMEAHIADAAITTNKIAGGAVTPTKIATAAVTTDKLQDGSVTAPKLADASVTQTKVAASAVGTVQLQDMAVTTQKLQFASVTSSRIGDAQIVSVHFSPQAVNTAALADNGVTGAKIANAAVTSPKLASSAVTTDALQDGSVTQAKLSSNSVGTPSIIDQAVTQSKLANNAVGTSQLVDLAVSTAKLADFAVQSAKLQDNAVTTSKLADNAVTQEKIAANAVRADRIEDEPGADEAPEGSLTLPTGSPGTITSVTITAPRDGYVLLQASGVFRVSAYSPGSALAAEVYLATTPFGQDEPIEFRLPSGLSSGMYAFPFSNIAMFPATAGAQTYYLTGMNALAGQTIQVLEARLQALYVPTQY